MGKYFYGILSLSIMVLSNSFAKPTMNVAEINGVAKEAAVEPSVQDRIDAMERELKALRRDAATQTKTESPKAKAAPKPTIEDANGNLKDALNPDAPSPAKSKVQKADATAPADAPKDPSKDFDRAQELYDQAQVFISQKRLPQAQQILEEIISAYADAPQYVPARYWLGEIYFARQDYLNASLSFGDIYMCHKSGATLDPVKDHVAESLIKLAYCLKMMKKKTEACVTLKQVSTDFKKLPRNITMLAQDIRQDLKCPK